MSAREGFDAARSSFGRHALNGGVGVNDETLKLCVLGTEGICDFLECCSNVSIRNCGAT